MSNYRPLLRNPEFLARLFTSEAPFLGKCSFDFTPKSEAVCKICSTVISKSIAIQIVPYECFYAASKALVPGAATTELETQ